MKFLFSLCLILLTLRSASAAEGAAPYHLNEGDKAVLSQVETYLSGIHTISSDFIQASPNGELAGGKFYLERPGRLRMEYLPPVPVLMVTSGSEIIYYDRELDQVSRIALKSTLVGFLAREKVKFDDSVVITYFDHSDNSVRLSVVQADKPGDGTLTLELSDNPMVLRTMVVSDSSGQKTTLSLNNARFNIALDNSLFVFKDPHLNKNGSIKN